MAVFGRIDAGFDQGGLDLVDGLRLKMVQARDILDGVRGDKFGVFAHRNDHFVFVRPELFADDVLGLRALLSAARSAGGSNRKHTGFQNIECFGRKAFGRDQPQPVARKIAHQRDHFQAVAPEFRQITGGSSFESISAANRTISPSSVYLVSSKPSATAERSFSVTRSITVKSEPYGRCRRFAAKRSFPPPPPDP